LPFEDDLFGGVAFETARASLASVNADAGAALGLGVEFDLFRSGNPSSMGWRRGKPLQMIRLKWLISLVRKGHRQ
jgi:hypothetical protein